MITAQRPLVMDTEGAQMTRATSDITLFGPSDNRALLRRLLGRLDLIEPIRRRAVQDAITDALAETWIWRSYAFEQARPRPGDFTGLATPAELAAADERCAEVALACRNHADALARGWFE